MNTSLSNGHSPSLAIVGYREFTNYGLLTREVDKFIKFIGIPECIISGGAKGADSLAERYANDRGILLVVYPPDWKTYGKSAGVRRNTDIVNNCTHLIAFLSSKSVGTLDSIRKATNGGKTVKVINID